MSCVVLASRSRSRLLIGHDAPQVGYFTERERWLLIGRSCSEQRSTPPQLGRPRRAHRCIWLCIMLPFVCEAYAGPTNGRIPFDRGLRWMSYETAIHRRAAPETNFKQLWSSDKRILPHVRPHRISPGHCLS